MQFEDIQTIANANATNRFICQHLDEATMLMVIDIMSLLDKNDFKEYNPKANFEFTDIPIPYDKLEKIGEGNKSTCSPDIQKQLQDLYIKINQAGSNIEYPFVLGGNQQDKCTYSFIKPFEISTENPTQSCSYDWKYIEDLIAKANNNPKTLALLHTHPMPIEKEHNTLFNKYSEELSAYGIRPDGLNLSISDIYANMYLDMLIEKYDKPITAESMVLLHDGTMISFSTKTAVSLRNQQNIESLSVGQKEKKLKEKQL